MSKIREISPQFEMCSPTGFCGKFEFQIGTMPEKFRDLRQFKFGVSNSRPMIFKERRKHVTNTDWSHPRERNFHVSE